MKQRMRKKPLYRRVRKAKLAKVLRLMKKIAEILPTPPIDPDEYHSISGNLPSVWATGHVRAVNLRAVNR